MLCTGDEAFPPCLVRGVTQALGHHHALAGSDGIEDALGGDALVADRLLVCVTVHDDDVVGQRLTDALRCGDV